MVDLIEFVDAESVLLACKAEVQFLSAYVVQTSDEANVLVCGVVAAHPEHIAGILDVGIGVMHLLALLVRLSCKGRTGCQELGKGHVEFLGHVGVLPVGLQSGRHIVGQFLGVLVSCVAYRLRLLFGMDAEDTHPERYDDVVLQRHVALHAYQRLLGDVAQAVDVDVVAPLVSEEVAQRPCAFLPELVEVVPCPCALREQVEVVGLLLHVASATFPESVKATAFVQRLHVVECQQRLNRFCHNQCSFSCKDRNEGT